MKLRKVEKLVGEPSAPTPLSRKELLDYLNTYGYLMPDGGTPWDHEMATVRVLGAGPNVLDILVGFAPAETFETPSERWGAWPAGTEQARAVPVRR